MTSDTRAKMVAGAADLMSRRGVNATSMREVVRHTGTPRGSIGHHFPGGKQQLIEDALAFAGRQVSGPLRHLTQKQGAIGGLHAFISLWRQTLERTKFQAGCPVLAVAVEQLSAMRPTMRARRTRPRSGGCSIWRTACSPIGRKSWSRRCGTRG